MKVLGKGSNPLDLLDTTKNDSLKYSVGPLLYMPALRTDIADKIISFRIYKPLSVAICLEDTIKDSMVNRAEKNLVIQIGKLSEMVGQRADITDLPLIFIRVRNPGQIKRIADMLGDSSLLICGFILSKIDDAVFETYLPVIKEINKGIRKFYFMPIIENHSIISPVSRYEKLQNLYDLMEEVHPYILNVRVGGNDFSSCFALVNSVEQTVYDLMPVAGILSDISTIFSRKYIVSAPVWNYFDNGKDDRWKTGLVREMNIDKSAGFIGKTVIHPSQIPVVIENMKVMKDDYNDAVNLLNSIDSSIQVIKGGADNRMVEHKVHKRWAEKTVHLASVYGIR